MFSQCNRFSVCMNMDSCKLVRTKIATLFPSFIFTIDNYIIINDTLPEIVGNLHEVP